MISISAVNYLTRRLYLTGQNLVQEEAGIELFYNYEGW